MDIWGLTLGFLLLLWILTFVIIKKFKKKLMSNKEEVLVRNHTNENKLVVVIDANTWYYKSQY